MFSTFWSLCGACPSTNITKLHSEYRSTYRWHEYSPNKTHEVIRKAPHTKGGVGVRESAEGNSRVRVSKSPPPLTEKALVNGSVGGLPPAGISSSGRAAVTTVPPKSIQTPPISAVQHHQQQQVKQSRDPNQKDEKEKGEIQQPETPPLESEQGGMDLDDRFLKRSYKSEYRKKFRPFSQYQYVDGKFQKAKAEEAGGGGEGGAENAAGNAWYKEVLELRRQAGQYRCRGWGVETASERMTEIYSKQVELWEQVSRRSSLQALSLASAAPSRPISKAEKEIENSRRSSPIKHARERPGTAPSKHKLAPVHSQKAALDKVDAKPKDSAPPRHHYDRTTGTGGRSVSVGPENRSPKRSSRPPSSHAPAPAAKPERRPRPTSLSTNSRRKGADTAIPHHEAKKPTKKLHDVSASPKRSDLKNRENKRRSSEDDSKKDKEGRDIIKETAGKDSIEALKESSSGRKSTPEPRFDPEKFEPVVKTPPEPTRVKSPDQVMVKSPDPVNWTVPLDTGKTFTVTHNIPEGESARGTPSTEHKPPLESRTRQTPEPTRVYQGSLAGTPITTAGTTGSSPLATTATTSSTAPPAESKISSTKTDSIPSTLGSSVPASTGGSQPQKQDKPSEKALNLSSEASVKFSPDTKFNDKNDEKKPLPEPSLAMSKSIISHDKNRSISPEVEPLNKHDDAFASQQVAKSSAESLEKDKPISSSSPPPPIGLSSGTLSVVGSLPLDNALNNSLASVSIVNENESNTLSDTISFEHDSPDCMSDPISISFANESMLKDAENESERMQLNDSNQVYDLKDLNTAVTIDSGFASVKEESVDNFQNGFNENLCELLTEKKIDLIQREAELEAKLDQNMIRLKQEAFEKDGYESQSGIIYGNKKTQEFANNSSKLSDLEERINGTEGVLEHITLSVVDHSNKLQESFAAQPPTKVQNKKQISLQRSQDEIDEDSVNDYFTSEKINLDNIEHALEIKLNESLAKLSHEENLYDLEEKQSLLENEKDLHLLQPNHATDVIDEDEKEIASNWNVIESSSEVLSKQLLNSEEHMSYLPNDGRLSDLNEDKKEVFVMEDFIKLEENPPIDAHFSELEEPMHDETLLYEVDGQENEDEKDFGVSNEGHKLQNIHNDATSEFAKEKNHEEKDAYIINESKYSDEILSSDDDEGEGKMQSNLGLHENQGRSHIYSPSENENIIHKQSVQEHSSSEDDDIGVDEAESLMNLNASSIEYNFPIESVVENLDYSEHFALNSMKQKENEKDEGPEIDDFSPYNDETISKCKSISSTDCIEDAATRLSTHEIDNVKQEELEDTAQKKITLEVVTLNNNSSESIKVNIDTENSYIQNHNAQKEMFYTEDNADEPISEYGTNASFKDGINNEDDDNITNFSLNDKILQNQDTLLHDVVSFVANFNKGEQQSETYENDLTVNKFKNNEEYTILDNLKDENVEAFNHRFVEKLQHKLDSDQSDVLAEIQFSDTDDSHAIRSIDIDSNSNNTESDSKIIKNLQDNVIVDKFDLADDHETRLGENDSCDSHSIKSIESDSKSNDNESDSMIIKNLQDDSIDGKFDIADDHEARLGENDSCDAHSIKSIESDSKSNDNESDSMIIKNLQDDTIDDRFDLVDHHEIRLGEDDSCDVDSIKSIESDSKSNDNESDSMIIKNIQDTFDDKFDLADNHGTRLGENDSCDIHSIKSIESDSKLNDNESDSMIIKNLQDDPIHDKFDLADDHETRLGENDSSDVHSIKSIESDSNSNDNESESMIIKNAQDNTINDKFDLTFIHETRLEENDSGGAHPIKSIDSESKSVDAESDSMIIKNVQDNTANDKFDLTDGHETRLEEFDSDDVHSFKSKDSDSNSIDPISDSLIIKNVQEFIVDDKLALNDVHESRLEGIDPNDAHSIKSLDLDYNSNDAESDSVIIKNLQDDSVDDKFDRANDHETRLGENDSYDAHSIKLIDSNSNSNDIESNSMIFNSFEDNTVDKFDLTDDLLSRLVEKDSGDSHSINSNNSDSDLNDVESDLIIIKNVQDLTVHDLASADDSETELENNDPDGALSIKSKGSDYDSNGEESSSLIIRNEQDYDEFSQFARKTDDSIQTQNFEIVDENTSEIVMKNLHRQLTLESTFDLKYSAPINIENEFSSKKAFDDLCSYNGEVSKSIHRLEIREDANKDEEFMIRDFNDSLKITPQLDIPSEKDVLSEVLHKQEEIFEENKERSNYVISGEFNDKEVTLLLTDKSSLEHSDARLFSETHCGHYEEDNSHYDSENVMSYYNNSPLEKIDNPELVQMENDSTKDDEPQCFNESKDKTFDDSDDNILSPSIVYANMYDTTEAYESRTQFMNESTEVHHGEIEESNEYGNVLEEDAADNNEKEEIFSNENSTRVHDDVNVHAIDKDPSLESQYHNIEINEDRKWIEGQNESECENKSTYDDIENHAAHTDYNSPYRTNNGIEIYNDHGFEDLSSESHNHCHDLDSKMLDDCEKEGLFESESNEDANVRGDIFISNIRDTETLLETNSNENDSHIDGNKTDEYSAQMFIAGGNNKSIMDQGTPHENDKANDSNDVQDESAKEIMASLEDEAQDSSYSQENSQVSGDYESKEVFHDNESYDYYYINEDSEMDYQKNIDHAYENDGDIHEESKVHTSAENETAKYENKSGNESQNENNLDAEFYRENLIYEETHSVNDASIIGNHSIEDTYNCDNRMNLETLQSSEIPFKFKDSEITHSTNEEPFSVFENSLEKTAVLEYNQQSFNPLNNDEIYTDSIGTLSEIDNDSFHRKEELNNEKIAKEASEIYNPEKNKEFLDLEVEKLIGLQDNDMITVSDISTAETLSEKVSPVLIETMSDDITRVTNICTDDHWTTTKYVENEAFSQQLNVETKEQNISSAVNHFDDGQIFLENENILPCSSSNIDDLERSMNNEESHGPLECSSIKYSQNDDNYNQYPYYIADQNIHKDDVLQENIAYRENAGSIDVEAKLVISETEAHDSHTSDTENEINHENEEETYYQNILSQADESKNEEGQMISDHSSTNSFEQSSSNPFSQRENDDNLNTVQIETTSHPYQFSAKNISTTEEQFSLESHGYETSSQASSSESDANSQKLSNDAQEYYLNDLKFESTSKVNGNHNDDATSSVEVSPNISMSEGSNFQNLSEMDSHDNIHSDFKANDIRDEKFEGDTALISKNNNDSKVFLLEKSSINGENTNVSSGIYEISDEDGPKDDILNINGSDSLNH